MPMRDYEDLKNLKIPAEQERIMDIICDAWDECMATDCQSECKDNFYHRNSPAIDMMDEIVAENRGLMEKKVREAIEDFDFSDVQDEIYEVAQEVIYKRIFGRENENNEHTS